MFRKAVCCLSMLVALSSCSMGKFEDQKYTYRGIEICEYQWESESADRYFASLELPVTRAEFSGYIKDKGWNIPTPYPESPETWCWGEFPFEAHEQPLYFVVKDDVNGKTLELGFFAYFNEIDQLVGLQTGAFKK